jgi:D-alanyl-D-alanine carboxypeptidase
MRHSISFVVAGLVFGSLAFVYAQVFSYEPPVVISVPSPVFHVDRSVLPELSVSAYAVFDVATGEVLFGHAIDTPLPIASVTKLFTAVAILDGFDPEATTTITWTDVAGEGDAGKLKPTQAYSYRELLFPLLLESSNDAASALERATDGGVIAVMNQVAQDAGATDTTFADASGLSSNNRSTVADLITVTRAINERYPFVFDISELPQYIGAYTGWQNNNPVMDTTAYAGGKHGYTEAAGRTLVAQFDESFTVGDRTIGYIILGSSDLKADMALLRNFTRDAVDFK